MSCSPVASSASLTALSEMSIPQIAFGARKWEYYFGIRVVEPALPPDIDKILTSPCSIFPGNKVKDTHFLVLIPEGMTLEKLEQLTQNAKHGNKVSFIFKDEEEWTKHKDMPSDKTHWILMTKEVLPQSRNETWKRQKALAKTFSAQGYDIPSSIEVAACLLLEHMQTGERVWENPFTFARCLGDNEDVIEAMGWISWPVCIGGFTPSFSALGMQSPGLDGLSIRVFYDTFLTLGHAGWGNQCVGITLARKF